MVPSGGSGTVALAFCSFCSAPALAWGPLHLQSQPSNGASSQLWLPPP